VFEILSGKCLNQGSHPSTCENHRTELPRNSDASVSGYFMCAGMHAAEAPVVKMAEAQQQHACIFGTVFSVHMSTLNLTV
jgi:hypothetical protein